MPCQERTGVAFNITKAKVLYKFCCSEMERIEKFYDEVVSDTVGVGVCTIWTGIIKTCPLIAGKLLIKSYNRR